MAENDENENLLGNSKVKIIKKLNLEGKDIISRRNLSNATRRPALILLVLFIVISLIQVNRDLFIRENIFAASSGLPTIEVTYGGVKQNLTGEALESLKEYILMNVASEDFAGVKSNLEVTRVLHEMGRDAAYFNGSVLDHACPMTIRRSTGKLIRKPPDVIGIGFAKCGTGSLDFLDCHPSITFRTAEPKFFSDERMVRNINDLLEKHPPDHIIDLVKRKFNTEIKKFVDAYLERLPLAAKDEILIEKSPQYSGGGSTEVRLARAKAMKAVNPDVKLIGIACDPVKRAYSQLNMKERRTETLKESGKPCRNKGCLLGTIEEAFERFTEKQQATFDAGLPMGFADYANQVQPFVDIVGAENFHLVDGENLVRNPDHEWGKLLDFLKVEKDHFKFYKDEEKGFPCLDKPIKHCLNTAKGTSRKTDVRQQYGNFTDIWDGLYKPTVLKMLDFFKICDTIDDSCCKKLSDENSSFSWIHRYACTDI